MFNVLPLKCSLPLTITMVGFAGLQTDEDAPCWSLRFGWPRLDDEDEVAVEEELGVSSESIESECHLDLRDPFPLCF